MVMVDPEADDDVVGSVVERITQALTEGGAQVTNVDRWGRRKLAFEIDHKAEGFYLVLAVTADPDALPQVDRMLSLADEVMRFKIVRAAA